MAAVSLPGPEQYSTPHRAGPGLPEKRVLRSGLNGDRVQPGCAREEDLASGAGRAGPDQRSEPRAGRDHGPGTDVASFCFTTCLCAGLPARAGVFPQSETDEPGSSSGVHAFGVTNAAPQASADSQKYPPRAESKWTLSSALRPLTQPPLYSHSSLTVRHRFHAVPIVPCTKPRPPSSTRPTVSSQRAGQRSGRRLQTLRRNPLQTPRQNAPAVPACITGTADTTSLMYGTYNSSPFASREVPPRRKGSAGMTNSLTVKELRYATSYQAAPRGHRRGRNGLASIWVHHPLVTNEIELGFGRQVAAHLAVYQCLGYVDDQGWRLRTRFLRRSGAGTDADAL